MCKSLSCPAGIPDDQQRNPCKGQALLVTDMVSNSRLPFLGPNDFFVFLSCAHEKSSNVELIKYN